jgi:hypothetical protein
VRAPQRYVLVHSNRGIARPDRLAGFSLRMRKTYWVHSVGRVKAQADAVAERSSPSCSTGRPPSTGSRASGSLMRRRSRCRRTTPSAAGLYYGVDQFDFYTTPTADA